MRGDRALVGASNLLGYKEYTQQDFKYIVLSFDTTLTTVWHRRLQSTNMD